MKTGNTLWNGRRGWELDNGLVRLVLLQGGGHIAAVVHRDRPNANPLWKPVWKAIEPWDYRPERHDLVAGEKLLGCISGHNICLGWFGPSAPGEIRMGMGTHGEAPVSRWRLLGKSVTSRGVRMTVGCELPASGMRMRRTIASGAGSCVIRVVETVENLLRRDVPYTICEHVTYGPPFLEKGVTTFDMPATRGHTYPGKFGSPQRMVSDSKFAWPDGPRKGGGTVNLRMIEKRYRRSSDFTAQLMDTSRDDAWFAAVNPRLGVLSAYWWKRADFPWVGNWEENCGRKQPPWGGRSLTRGMEFANSPFPLGLREQVRMGRFHGLPTFGWLPARGKVTMEFAIISLPVDSDTAGVAGIVRSGRRYVLDLVKTSGERKWVGI